jgi:hypothetical protein
LNVDPHTGQLFERNLQGTDIQERCFLRWIDEDIEIAVFPVRPVKDRAKDARIGQPMALRHTPYFFTVPFERCRGTHRRSFPAI